MTLEEELADLERQLLDFKLATFTEFEKFKDEMMNTQSINSIVFFGMGASLVLNFVLVGLVVLR